MYFLTFTHLFLVINTYDISNTYQLSLFKLFHINVIIAIASIVIPLCHEILEKGPHLELSINKTLTAIYLATVEV